MSYLGCLTRRKILRKKGRLDGTQLFLNPADSDSCQVERDLCLNTFSPLSLSCVIYYTKDTLAVVVLMLLCANIDDDTTTMSLPLLLPHVSSKPGRLERGERKGNLMDDGTYYTTQDDGLFMNYAGQQLARAVDCVPQFCWKIKRAAVPM